MAQTIPRSADLGLQSKRDYDAHGNRTSVTDALNNQTAFAYDAGDRLKTITYPGGTLTTTFVYDNRGRRTSVTDQNGKTTTYAYDDADRLTSVTDAATHVTTYGYDTESNLTSLEDANLHTTSFTYDAFGRVTKTTFPSGFIETYGYDAAGNLTPESRGKQFLRGELLGNRVMPLLEQALLWNPVMAVSPKSATIA